MGANIINTIAEKAKEVLAAMGMKTGISILSNYCVQRRAISSFKIPVSALNWKGIPGEEVANKIIEAYKFA
jgi:hydroxymethylglutaryl-CoA reductase